jgi:serine protease AprX
MGIAPKANVLAVRISDDNGMSSEADVISALQWIYTNKAAYNIRVVNLSLNSAVAQSYHTSPLCAAAEILWFNGITVVVSAGNNGSADLFPPANDPFVITVGAINDGGTLDAMDDVVASYSAYGQDEMGYTKPEILAPGSNLIAYLPDSGALTIPVQHPENVVSPEYFRMSGTSMAAPVVAGSVAILLNSNPNLTPDQIKFRLMATANKAWPGYDPLKAGAGRLDIYAAVKGTSTESANTNDIVSTLLTTGTDPVNSSVAWNSVAWNSVAWNSVAWNSVAWNSVAWNSVAWNSDHWGE